MQRVYIYPRFNRLWHWCQALLVLFMALTGLEIHFQRITIFGWQNAIELHRVLAWAFVILMTLAIFWHLTTGAWRHYIPTRRYLKEMVAFYITGIFRGTPHPVNKTQLSKLNPLQRLVYLGLKIMVIPVLVTSGFLYYYYNDLEVLGFGGISLEVVAYIHTFTAYALIAFMVTHIYLSTTGRTLMSNLKAMVTGWEAIEEEGQPA